jgi:hypothetical protein
MQSIGSHIVDLGSLIRVTMTVDPRATLGIGANRHVDRPAHKRGRQRDQQANVACSIPLFERYALALPSGRLR